MKSNAETVLDGMLRKTVIWEAKSPALKMLLKYHETHSHKLECVIQKMRASTRKFEFEPQKGCHVC